MTVEADINAMTGNSFNATLVTAARVAAENKVAGWINETYTATANTLLDSLVAEVGANILRQSKIDKQNLTSGGFILNTLNLLTPSVQESLDMYTSRSRTFAYSRTTSRNANDDYLGPSRPTRS